MTKSAKRLVAGGAIVLMSTLGFFGGCFGHGHDNCPVVTAGPVQVCQI